MICRISRISRDGGHLRDFKSIKRRAISLPDHAVFSFAQMRESGGIGEVWPEEQAGPRGVCLRGRGKGTEGDW